MAGKTKPISQIKQLFRLIKLGIIPTKGSIPPFALRAVQGTIYYFNFLINCSL